MRYHVFTLSVGDAHVEYVHLHGDLGRHEAEEKLLDMITRPAKRKSTIEQRRRASRERIISYRFARPTSEYKRMADDSGLAFPVTVGKAKGRKR